MAQEETGAAAGSGRRAGWRADSSGAGWDPEQWWSFGQAADRADVTHRTLQAWAEEGKLMVRTAWREGMEVRLVRAGDVARLAPGVAFSEGAAASLEERALFTGPRRSGLGAGAPAAPRSQEDIVPRPHEDDRDALRRTAELEIERLRAELEALRGRGGARAAASPASPAAMDLWSAEEQGGLGAGAGRRWRRTRWLGTFLAGVTLGATFGWVTSEPGSPAAEVGPGLTDAAPRSSTRLAAAAAGRTAGSLHEGPQLPGPQLPGPQLPDRGAAEVIAAVAVPVVVAQGASRQEVVSVSPAGSLPAPGAGAADAAPTKRLPVLLGDLVRISATPLDGTTVCAYRGAGLGSAELQFVLGGCFGERLSDGAGVLATDRVLGVACCKHHAAVQRLRRPTAGARALDIARQEAEWAVQEGFLPPMLELRAERAGILFARHLAGEWRASGFDGAVEGRVHRWAQLGALGVPAQDEPVRVELRSWIERGEDGGLARYRLVTELGRDAVEDRALSFEWLDSR